MATGNIVALAFATYRFTESRAASTAACFVMALSVDILFLNTAVWSDAEFILCVVSSLLCLTVYFENRRYGYLVAGALVAALACLARYVGVALIATGIVGVVTFGPGRFRRRVIDAALFGVLAAAPGVAWLLRDRSMAGNLTNRVVRTDGNPIADIAALVQTMGSWWLPGTNRIELIPGQSWFVAVCVLAVGVAILYTLVRWVTPEIDGRTALIQTPVVFLLFGILYIGSIFLATGILATVPMDNRILAPSFVTSVLVVALIAHTAHRCTTSRFLDSALSFGCRLGAPQRCRYRWSRHPLQSRGPRVRRPSWRSPLVEKALTDAVHTGIYFELRECRRLPAWPAGSQSLA